MAGIVNAVMTAAVTPTRRSLAGNASVVMTTAGIASAVMTAAATPARRLLAVNASAVMTMAGITNAVMIGAATPALLLTVKWNQATITADAGIANRVTTTADSKRQTN
jgi:hypothetical protein